MKKIHIAALALIATFALSGCGSKLDEVTVRYLNFKPEDADVWEEIAQIYKEETGVNVEILNSPSN